MKTRVLFWDMPEMLRDIVSAVLAKEGDFEICPTHSDLTLSQTIEKLGPHAVVACNGPGNQHEHDLTQCESYEDLLMKHPRIRLVSITQDGHTANVCRLVVHKLVVKDFSPGELAGLLRQTTTSMTSSVIDPHGAH